MAEYIDRQKAIEWFRPYGLMEQKLEFWEIKEQLEGMKDADVAPVVHAHWYRPKLAPTFRIDAPYCRCSNCNDDEDYTSPYCPNCGAKMDEEIKVL